MKSKILNTKNAKGGNMKAYTIADYSNGKPKSAQCLTSTAGRCNMQSDQTSASVSAAIKSMEAALDDIKRRLDAGECLDPETAANLNALRGASAKLRDVYIVHACATGMKQCKVAELLGMSAGRIVQILTEQSAAAK